jgi:hypothetical protein
MGLEAAFAEANETNILRGVTFSLVSYDDGYDVSNISRIAYAPIVLARSGKQYTAIIFSFHHYFRSLDFI